MLSLTLRLAAHAARPAARAALWSPYERHLHRRSGQLRRRQALRRLLLVLAKQQRTTKTNKPYLNLILGDKTGQLEGRVWEPADPRIAKDFDKGDIVKARGSASRFDDRLQMKIDQLRVALPSEVDKIRSAAFHHLRRGRALASASRLRRELHQPRPQAAARPPCWPIRRSPRPIREAPAAKQLHHAWLGGLLEHVVSLLTLADRVAPHYPLLDRDLLLTGVILHDIGKVRELSWEIGFEYTVEGSSAGPHPDGRGAGREDHRQPAQLSAQAQDCWCCT